MNKIYLPTLKNIKIENFSLYPKALDFNYDFINGVNLIIGGNGIGKTTFINLIKYGLIGLYKKGLDVRTYKGEKREGRTQYPANYFRNRMDESFEDNISAKIILTFSVNDTTFIVTRELFEIRLVEVIIVENNIEYKIDGEIIQQHKYERLADKEKQCYLQYKYEEKVAEKCNFYSFNDLIFFVNNILMFGETRDTILWNSDIQERILSKYFNDPELDNKYEEYRRWAKYYDSLARHNSEEIKAINKVMKKIDSNLDSNNEINKFSEIDKIKAEVMRINKNLVNINDERIKIENLIKVKTSDVLKKRNKLNEAELRVKKEESLMFKKIWGDLNPNYDLYFKSIKLTNLCPLCNQLMKEELISNIIKRESECLLCHNPIRESYVEVDDKFEALKDEIEKELKIIQQIESDIYNMEKQLDSLDVEYNKTKINLFKKQSELRQLEHSTNSDATKSDETITYQTMINHINEWELKKVENQELSYQYTQRAEDISKRIDEDRVTITKELSGIFSEFAESFISLPSKITYDNFDDSGKRYYPVIDSKPRIDSEELSESQRFFIDHSFRMSLLNLFYTKPAFFICETPDSSLDISYERNAANIFLKYLNKPNSLIITSNLNNSEFLEYIIDNSNNIKAINLLNFGNMTKIQSNSERLKEISSRIEEKINEKNR